MMKKNQLICPDCGKEKKEKAYRCVPCGFKYDREKNRKYAKEHRKPVNIVTKKCKQCEHEFISNENYGQYFCRKECSDIWHTIQGNSKWAKRNLEDQPRRNGEKVAYSAVSKKPTEWMKKFKACRG